MLRVQCYGCGALNEHGLHIKSRWEGDDLVCRWQPQRYHIGHPGYVYGGTMASVVDCHAIWTALATRCRDDGIDLAHGAPPFSFVTGKLSISYVKPALIARALELRARVVDASERRATVACRVLQ
ncbi:MAG TPA: PaaI family thioesterase, partial [Burkholderiaceae bacterium]